MYRPSGNYGHYREQSDEFEQPLIEEFDPDFQPDEDEIRMYAVQKLGMELPQDQMFLHLAKEALKKPLPESWGAYQRADGDVYYKHKVTQQQTTEHPIDVEYRRIYQQEKDKVARRTLKSKTSKPAGLAGMKLLGNIAKEGEFNAGSYGGSGFGGSSSGQQSYLNQPIPSNISVMQEPDQFELNREFEQSLKKYQQSLLKDFQQFRFKEQKQFTERERKLRDSHQEEFDRINCNSMLPISFEERLKQQKNSLRKQIEEQQESDFKRQLRDQEQRLKREDMRSEKDLQAEWNLKLKDIEKRNNQKIEAKNVLVQRIKEDLELEKHQREQRRVNEALRAKEEFKRKLHEFNQQADRHLNVEIQKISRDRAEKVRQRKNELEAEYNRIRKMLKSTPQDKIKQLIERKTKLQQISDKKYDIHRIKELQLIQRNTKATFEEEKYKLRERLEAHYHQIENDVILKQQTKLRRHVDNYSKDSIDRLRKKEKEVFDRFKEKLSQYQLNKNNKLINARQNFITEIESQKNHMEREHGVQSIRLLVREKEFQLANREKMLKGLRDDIKLHERKLKKYELDRKLYRGQTDNDITQALKTYLTNLKQQSAPQQQNSSSNKAIYSPMKIQQKNTLPAVFAQHQRRLDELKKILVSDKDILGKVLSHLQSTSMLPFYDRQKIMKSNLPSDVQLIKLQSIGAAKNDLIKTYNSDVRKIRQNEKVLTQFELILKKAQYDEQTALMQLRLFEVDYKVPQLRAELQSSSSEIATHLDRLKQTKSGVPSNPFHTDMLSTKKVQDLFDDHSRFLMNVKQQLNSKMWQIRGINYHSNLYQPPSYRF